MFCPPIAWKTQHYMTCTWVAAENIDRTVQLQGVHKHNSLRGSVTHAPNNGNPSHRAHAQQFSSNISRTEPTGTTGAVSSTNAPSHVPSLMLRNVLTMLVAKGCGGFADKQRGAGGRGAWGSRLGSMSVGTICRIHRIRRVWGDHEMCVCVYKDLGRTILKREARMGPGPPAVA